MSEWVSVEDRLPEESEVSNCTGFSKDVYPWRNQSLLGFSDGVKNSFGEVTHWMPLPEPPKL